MNDPNQPQPPPPPGWVPPPPPPGWNPYAGQQQEWSQRPAISPPWEDSSQPLARRWWDTFKSSFTAPTEFFAQMTPGVSVNSSIAYAMIGAVVGAVGSFLLQVGVAGLGASLGSAPAQAVGAQVLGGVLGAACGLVIAPIVVAISIVIASAIYHVLLMVFGGANSGFETTARVVSYVQGTANALNLIPCLGAIVGGLWAIYATIVGLAAAHRTETWKAAAAVLLPVVVCLGLVVVGVLALLASGFSTVTR